MHICMCICLSAQMNEWVCISMNVSDFSYLLCLVFNFALNEYICAYETKLNFLLGQTKKYTFDVSILRDRMK